MKITWVIFYVLAAMAGGYLGYVLLQPDLEPDAPQQEAVNAPRVLAPGSVTASGLVEAWDWQALEEASQPDAPEEVRVVTSDAFHVETLYKELSTIRLKSDGTVRLDDTALKALDRALDHGALQLDSEDLRQMERTIRAALPGEIGEEAAEVVGNYYRYLEMKRNYTNGNEPATPDEMMAQYEGLASMRSQVLGQSVAEQLFYKADNDARYFIEVQKLAQNEDLSDDERSQQQAALQQRYHQNAPPIPGADQRLAQFRAEQAQLITGDTLTKSQQRTRSLALAAQRFSEDELAVLADYGIDLAAETEAN